MTITDDDLDRWEALAGAATPGPWTTDDAPRLQGSVNAGLHQVAAAMGQAAMHDHRADTAEVQRANAAFIADARTAVPDLCAEVRRLRDLDRTSAPGDALIDLQAVCAERDALRAENERLRSADDLDGSDRAALRLVRYTVAADLKIERDLVAQRDLLLTGTGGALAVVGPAADRAAPRIPLHERALAVLDRLIGGRDG